MGLTTELIWDAIKIISLATIANLFGILALLRYDVPTYVFAMTAIWMLMWMMVMRIVWKMAMKLEVFLPYKG